MPTLVWVVEAVASVIADSEINPKKGTVIAVFEVVRVGDSRIAYVGYQTAGEIVVLKLSADVEDQLIRRVGFGKLVMEGESGSFVGVARLVDFRAVDAEPKISRGQGLLIGSMSVYEASLVLYDTAGR